MANSQQHGDAGLKIYDLIIFGDIHLLLIGFVKHMLKLATTQSRLRIESLLKYQYYYQRNEISQEELENSRKNLYIQLHSYYTALRSVYCIPRFPHADKHLSKISASNTRLQSSVAGRLPGLISIGEAEVSVVVL